MPGGGRGTRRGKKHLTTAGKHGGGTALHLISSKIFLPAYQRGKRGSHKAPRPAVQKTRPKFGKNFRRLYQEIAWCKTSGTGRTAEEENQAQAHPPREPLLSMRSKKKKVLGRRERGIRLEASLQEAACSLSGKKAPSPTMGKGEKGKK